MPEKAAPPVPERIDHYRLERRLGLGGMAEIFLAVDERSGRRVALKKILPHVAADADFRERFFHEIRIQISLKHPNIVELLDCSPDPAHAYIVMEYVNGGELYALKQATGRLPWEIALHAVDHALRGLSAAHRKGVIHRDVKPQNVMYTREGEVKIGDFGISHAAHLTRLTVTGTVVGTPAHMSPEQARGEELDPRTDLFSAGTVLYELLAGHNPFTADSIAATLRRVVEVEPEVPSLLDPTIPPSVDGFLRKLHAKDRRLRFASADAACEAIAGLFAREGVTGAAAAFREFLSNPALFMTERNRRLAAESAAAAERLLADRSAPPEEALWAAYRTVACAPDDAAAQTLLRTAAERAGQRERPVENPKIRELEQALRKDPDNPALLLQLAKLYRLEKDFINLMRFMRKLREVAPTDPYTQGQIAALVSTPAAAPAPLRPAGAAATRAQATVAVPAVPKARSSPWALVATAAATLLLVLGGVVLSRRANERFAMPEPAVRAAPQAPPAPGERRPDAAFEAVLARGAIAEKQSGAAAAAAVYRDALVRERSAEGREALLFALAEVLPKSGDAGGAIVALDRIAALGTPARSRALLAKAELLMAQKREPEAREIWEALSSADGPERWKAKVRLGMDADREHDSVRALALYEEVVARAPEGPETTAARLGAGALYREDRRWGAARQMFEDVLRTVPPGSAEAASARSGLASLEGK
jgi:tetratricopeptide (TPR) repeat protein